MYHIRAEAARSTGALHQRKIGMQKNRAEHLAPPCFLQLIPL